MKINMYKLLSNIDNKGVLEDCIELFDYIHILNNTIYICRTSTNWFDRSFYNRLPEFLEKMIDESYGYFIYNYIYRNLFKYLDNELNHYFDKLLELDKTRDGSFNKISANIIDLKEEIRSACSHLDSSYYNTVKSYQLKKILSDIYHAFDIILKCCSERVSVCNKYSEFLTKLREVCIDILSDVEFA